MNVAVDLTGGAAVSTLLRRLGALGPTIVAGPLYREAERIMTEAKKRTPVATGALRASGQVRAPVVTPFGVAVTMGFGNTSVGYAVYVHENLAARHLTGEAKFLENALNAARSGMEVRLADDFRQTRVLERSDVAALLGLAPARPGATVDVGRARPGAGAPRPRTGA